MTTHHDPLNAEERELAARLARLGGAREPAPALDARILAAARAAVAAPEASTTTTVAAAASTGDTASATATTPADRPASPTPHDTQASGGGTVVPMRSRRPAARWPLGFGLAASVVLAAGIGWRMYGNGAGDEQAMSDAALKTVEAPPPPEESVTEMVELEPPMQRTPPPEPPPLEPYQAKAPPPPPEPESVMSADAVAEPVAPTAYEFTMDESVHHDVAADAAAAPPAPPAPAAPPVPAAKVGAAEARRAESDRSLDSIQVTGSRVRTATANEGVAPVLEIERARAAAPARGGAGAPPQPAATAAHEPDAFDEQPPLSADSPEVRQAWFKRIRELLAAGRHDAAVESLQEFRRRYPTVELPQDLRKLASTLPAPTP